VRRLLDALGRSAVFARWACSGAVTGVVRAVLGAHDIRVVRAHHNCIMTKAPEFSSATGWHQDLRYWSYRRPELVNAWTALDTEAPDNGGMRLIPGSHRAEFPDEAFDADRFFRDDLPENRPWLERAVQADLAPGDVLFFHAGVLHSAGANRTGARKRAVVFSYRDVANAPIPGTRSAAKADLDPESMRCR
jgi:phytanoyl-CoA hydroxylase